MVSVRGFWQVSLVGFSLCLFPCAQVLLHELLNKWGPEGFDAFLRRVQRLYSSKAAFADSGAFQYLAGLAEWQPAEAGMFMWFKLTGRGSGVHSLN